MANRMTWSERRQMHLDLAREHGEKARAALKRFAECDDHMVDL